MIRASLILFAVNCAIFAYILRDRSLLNVLAISLGIGAATGAIMLLVDMYFDRKYGPRDRDKRDR